MTPNAAEDELLNTLFGGDIGDILALLDLCVVSLRSEVRHRIHRVCVPMAPAVSQGSFRSPSTIVTPRSVSSLARLMRPGQPANVELLFACEEMINNRAVLIPRRSHNRYALDMVTHSLQYHSNIGSSQ